MSADQNISKHPQEREISRWVQNAQLEGVPDAYRGKRQRTRYIVGMSLQLSANPEDPSATCLGTMHNVSGGGLGVWTKEKIEHGSVIFVRDDSAGTFSPWLQVEVKHVSLGLRGYLIGAAFTQAGPVDGLKRSATLDTTNDSEPRSPALPIFLSPTHPLRRRIALASAATSTMVLCIAMAMNNHVQTHGWTVWFLVVAVVGIYCLGSLMAWGILRPDLKFIQGFIDHLRQVSNEEEFQSPMIRPAPSRELEQLRLAFVDLTADLQKREDHQRIHRKKLEELASVKTNILSIVSHDLRTPLTSILLYAKMLQDDLDGLTADDQRHFLGIISDECKRLSRLVDDLLEVQGLEAGRAQWHMESQDLADTTRSCARVFEAMADSKSIRFSVDCPESLPPVEADADKISQVLSNLISNALKYTPAEGEVRLIVRSEANKILFTVADNGPGIPRDRWDQIFDRFTQLSDPNVRQINGVGLGLYIVRKIVERHGGIVWVDSEIGRGSQFNVSLPIRVDEPAPQESKVSPSAGRILVCDADPELTATMAMILQSQNLDVCTVHSGCRLLARLAQGDIDVLVTDLLLPDMNAPELLKSLEEMENRDFRIILHSYAGEATELRHKGIDVFLQRPASKEELIQAVRVAVQRRSALGKTALLVADDSASVEGLSKLLADKGHFPLLARTIGEAHRLIHYYPIDVAVFAENILKRDWIALEQVDMISNQNVPVFVLCDLLRKKERRLAQHHGVFPLAYQAGDEEAVVRTLLAAETALLQESIQ
jgi:signal transduction histidine kinase/CheY-like chemotaxis protein